MTHNKPATIVAFLAFVGPVASLVMAGEGNGLSITSIARRQIHQIGSPLTDDSFMESLASAAAAQHSFTSLLQPANADTPPTEAPESPRLRSWELPAIVVEGQSESALREEDRVGSYGQPRWTATRRFPSTRVYVIPEGKVEIEGWARATVKQEYQGGETEWRFLQEVEVGLPGRFQLDVYFRQDTDTDSDKYEFGGQFEVRWALADWGKIWGNPTLYFEYITLENRAEKIEPKLLLGGEIAEGWHWGVNAVAELEMGGEREYEYAVTTGVSRTLIDEKLSLGIETVLSMTDTKDTRGDLNTSLVIGPSLQWHPVPNMSVNVAPLIGVTSDSPATQIYLNVGWEF